MPGGNSDRSAFHEAMAAIRGDDSALMRGGTEGDILQSSGAVSNGPFTARETSPAYTLPLVPSAHISPAPDQTHDMMVHMALERNLEKTESYDEFCRSLGLDSTANPNQKSIDIASSLRADTGIDKLFKIRPFTQSHVTMPFLGDPEMKPMSPLGWSSDEDRSTSGKKIVPGSLEELRVFQKPDRDTDLKSGNVQFDDEGLEVETLGFDDRASAVCGTSFLMDRGAQHLPVDNFMDNEAGSSDEDGVDDDEECFYPIPSGDERAKKQVVPISPTKNTPTVKEITPCSASTLSTALPTDIAAPVIRGLGPQEMEVALEDEYVQQNQGFVLKSDPCLIGDDDQEPETRQHYRDVGISVVVDEGAGPLEERVDNVLDRLGRLEERMQKHAKACGVVLPHEWEHPAKPSSKNIEALLNEPAPSEPVVEPVGDTMSWEEPVEEFSLDEDFDYDHCPLTRREDPRVEMDRYMALNTPKSEKVCAS